MTSKHELRDCLTAACCVHWLTTDTIVSSLFFSTPLDYTFSAPGDDW
eukprot:CAMPEP_0202494410 /NCGR_PEP_ID=MMETSP1361-20130828/11558_1 /ASSEMBLY_ACC=CAM_ASM_000849 /TAXON_ID=210615 /ORGANISM="Staurosira complex sp., Strain CCMP2646" /LENGTH=46 /DNA_ID= /DNA_START= /DNA_END= /DNA_ORIENTATION=